MAISFEESLRMANEKNAMVRDVSVAAFARRSSGDAVYAASSDNWELSDKYLFYPDYSDDAYSTIDDNKNITLSSGQINLTQETNSQYIPFEMARYYDGFDLYSTKLSFHFVSKDGYEGYPDPINVYYSDSKIRFAWLVDSSVTAVEGTVSFEIMAVGINSMGDEYVWKTKPCNGLTILKSLSGNGKYPPLPQPDYYKKAEANALFATKYELSSVEEELSEKISDLDGGSGPGGSSEQNYSVIKNDDGDFTLVIS